MTSIPETMMGWRLAQDGSGAMRYMAMPVPKPETGEVLIRVRAAGVNRADLFQREGTYPAPIETQYVPGLEAAGEIVAIGSDVTGFAVGDAVCALLVGGGYAEYCVAPKGQVLPLPSGMTMTQAASLPEALATSWLALAMAAHLTSGESVLIHGGASGIGTMAIQVAKHLGARVFATAGSEAKCAACRELGAEVVNYKTEDFLSFIKARTEDRGVDVILDMVGGAYAERNLKALAVRGRMVTIALLGGARAETSLAGFLMKNLTWQALTLRSRSLAEKAEIMRQVQETLWPEIASGRISPVIDSVFAMKEAEKAHAHLHEGLHIGKIVLEV